MLRRMSLLVTTGISEKCEAAETLGDVTRCTGLMSASRVKEM